MNQSNIFTRREKDVIELLLQGKSNKQIALDLGISNRTVEFHLSNIYSKLGVSSRTEALLELMNSHLWKSTGKIQEKPTVTNLGGSPENTKDTVFFIFTRRTTMKKRYFTIGGILLLAIAILLAILLSAKSPKTLPTSSSSTEQIPTLYTPAYTPLQWPTQTPYKIIASSTTPPKEKTPQLEDGDIAHFVSETYPDGTRIEKGTSFTKTWVLQNIGSLIWTTDYALVLSSYSYPLGASLGEPLRIALPHIVKPGETVSISANLIAPDIDGVYEIDYQLQNEKGQIVSGDGSVVWLKVVIGDPQPVNSEQTINGITMTLTNVQKNEHVTSAEICIQLPDTQNWTLNGVILTAGNIQSSLSGYMLKNPKDPSTYTSTQRCYIVEFPVGVQDYGTALVTISINNIRVPAENNLAENCIRAKQELASQYPGLDFTCGPIGFYYSNLILPPDMDKNQADKIIMDALEQAIYGNWQLSE